MRKICLIAALVLTSIFGVQAQEKDLDARYAQGLLTPGTVAPDFTLRTYDGKDIRLSQYRGDYVVLDFWASWCPDCRKAIPEVKALFEDFRDYNVSFLGISYDTDRTAWVKTYWDKYQMTWTQVSELKKWKKETMTDRLYKIDWIPTMYLIDPDGKVVLGTVEVGKLRAKLEELRPGLTTNVADKKKDMVAARFTGGQAAQDKYIAIYQRIPPRAKKMQVQADMTLTFNVEMDGSITGARVIKTDNVRAIGPKYAKLRPEDQQELIDKTTEYYKREAVRLVNAMPKWQPATENGRPVQTKCQLPIYFRP